MDSIGLDTVAFIHYIDERGYPTDKTTDYLKKNYLDQGKLGAKCEKGGLYPAGHTTKTTGEQKSNHDQLAAPSLIDIEVLFFGLPEPIDLEINEDTQTLFWTDRGDPPTGNSLNSVKLEELKGLGHGDRNPKYDILTRQLHEATGLKLDQVNKHIYLTDLGGTLYRVSMEGKDKKKVYDEEAAFSGIGLVHV
ncbi:uncharacterized protein PAC_02222 [Phialocephala subalpina]|uniref:Uncharacterized protein n=1 Tax=Phialocephala subalpina TaxID=576137 RepID=A0A1L7WHU3_9HELO|nr:uncharacterized protein PAC_02222 [Phialocephala subalpina]